MAHSCAMAAAAEDMLALLQASGHEPDCLATLDDLTSTQLLAEVARHAGRAVEGDGGHL